MPAFGPASSATPRAVIFDIGRVIVRVNVAGVLNGIGSGLGLTSEQVWAALNHDPLWKDWQEGRIAPANWHAHVCEKFRVTLDLERFCAAWNAALDPETILPESLFEALSAQSRLALLSNTDPIHVAHMEAAFPFVRHFPVRIYSCRVSASKPAPAIYHHALRGVGVSASEAVYIDDIEAYVEAARALGMAGILFTSAEALRAELARLGLPAGSAL